MGCRWQPAQIAETHLIDDALQSVTVHQLLSMMLLGLVSCAKPLHVQTDVPTRPLACICASLQHRMFLDCD